MFQNGGQITQFLFHVFLILANIWKTTLPMEFLNEIWFIIVDYEYNYITEINLGFFFSCWILVAKHFSHTPT